MLYSRNTLVSYYSYYSVSCRIELDASQNVLYQSQINLIKAQKLDETDNWIDLISLIDENATLS